MIANIETTASSPFLTLIPSEIRYLIYAAYFSPVIRIHATVGAKFTGCRQLSFMNVDTHLAILRVCKQVYEEASTVFFEQCQFHVADCNCYGDGEVPLTARRRITSLVSPSAATGLSYARLSKLFDVHDLSEKEIQNFQFERLEYLTIFLLNASHDDNRIMGQAKTAVGPSM